MIGKMSRASHWWCAVGGLSRASAHGLTVALIRLLGLPSGPTVSELWGHVINRDSRLRAVLALTAVTPVKSHAWDVWGSACRFSITLSHHSPPARRPATAGSDRASTANLHRSPCSWYFVLCQAC